MADQDILIDIDIGGTNSVLAFVNVSGKVLERTSLPTRGLPNRPSYW